MKTYCGIDLHSNNNVMAVIDESDNILFEKKLSNNLGAVLDAPSAIRDPISGIASIDVQLVLVR